MIVLCALLLGDNGQCVAMLEVQPREVLGQSSATAAASTGSEQQDNRQQEQQQQQQQPGSANVSSAVVKEALFSCLEVRTCKLIALTEICLHVVSTLVHLAAL